MRQTFYFICYHPKLDILGIWVDCNWDGKYLETEYVRYSANEDDIKRAGWILYKKFKL